MQIDILITPNDGEPYTVQTNLFVVVAWERKTKRKASDLAHGIGMEDLAFMAFEACKQCNIPVPPSFDEYIKRCRSIEVVSEEPANPTNVAPTFEG